METSWGELHPAAEFQYVCCARNRISETVLHTATQKANIQTTFFAVQFAPRDFCNCRRLNWIEIRLSSFGSVPVSLLLPHRLHWWGWCWGACEHGRRFFHLEPPPCTSFIAVYMLRILGQGDEGGRRRIASEVNGNKESECSSQLWSYLNKSDWEGIVFDLLLPQRWQPNGFLLKFGEGKLISELLRT